MVVLEQASTGKKFLSIGKGGVFRETVDEGTVGAKLREYERKDGTMGSKWELNYKKLTDAHITDIRFQDGEFGESLNITIDDKYIISVPSSSNYAMTFMKIIPNVDLSEPLDISAYDFEDDKGKLRRGITIYQGVDLDGKPNKMSDYFSEPVEGSYPKKVNGFPEFDGDVKSKDDWKMYYLGVKKFLSSFTKEHIIPRIPSFVPTKSIQDVPEVYEYDDDIRPEDIEF